MAQATVQVRTGPLQADVPDIPIPQPGTPVTSNAKNPLHQAHTLPVMEGRRIWMSTFLSYRLTMEAQDDGGVMVSGNMIRIPGKDTTALFTNGLLILDLNNPRDAALDAMLAAHKLRGKTFYAQEDLLRQAREQQIERLKATIVSNPDLIQELKASLSEEDFQVLRILSAKADKDGEKAAQTKPTSPAAPTKKQ